MSMPSETADRRVGRLWQFSLRSLMTWMTAFCCLAAVIVVPPLLAIVVAVFVVAMAGVLVITIWQGRGWAKAFALGAAVPHLSIMLVIFNAPGPRQAFIAILVLELLACCAGVGAAAYHGFLARRDGYLPIPNLPLIRKWFANE